MKKFITCLSLLLITTAGFAQQSVQDDRKGSGIDFTNVQRTEKLQRLYEESEALNLYGTPEQIKANRLALKAAWAEINPEIAALYHYPEGDVFTEASRNSLNSSEENSSFRLEVHPNTSEVYGLSADYMDMKIASNGDIYIAFAAWDEAKITVRKSSDNGNTWTTPEAFTTPTTVKKVQLALITGIGDEWVNIYYLGTDNKLRIRTFSLMHGGDVDGTYNSLGDITDFSIAKSNEASTGLQRVFILYVSAAGEVKQARTMPANYGINFIDPVVLANGRQPHIAYGHNGSVYATYIGAGTGSVYAETHPNFLDPGTTNSYKIMGDPSTTEFRNPVIAAARKSLNSDNAIVVVEQRIKNTSDPYRQEVFRRKNGGVWSSIHLSPHIATYGLHRPSAFVNEQDGNETIRTSYVKGELGGQDFGGEGYSHTYNGMAMEAPEHLTDPTIDTMTAIIGETSDGQVCMAYIQLYQGQAYGIYFTSPNVLSVENKTIESLSVYPVPANESVTVSASTTIDKVKVSSVLGQHVMEVSNNSNSLTLDTSSLAKGIYFLEIHSEGRSETRKIIKN